MSLYYESHGEGPAIVCAHGVGGNHASWFQQVPVLSRAFRVVTFDHRGFGRSEDPDGRGRDAFVDDLRELLDTLEIDEACLIGQSMGGGTAIGFAAKYPKRVRALVIADSLFGLALPPPLQTRFERARAEADVLPQAERVLGAELRASQPDKVHLYASLGSFNRTNRQNLGGSWEPLCSLERLAETKIPILFVVGQEDILVPPALVHDVASLLPGSFVVEIAGAGHSPYFERPVEFNDRVLSFLHAVGLRGAAREVLTNSSGYTEVGEE